MIWSIWLFVRFFAIIYRLLCIFLGFRLFLHDANLLLLRNQLFKKLIQITNKHQSEIRMRWVQTEIETKQTIAKSTFVLCCWLLVAGLYVGCVLCCLYCVPGTTHRSIDVLFWFGLWFGFVLFSFQLCFLYLFCNAVMTSFILILCFTLIGRRWRNDRCTKLKKYSAPIYYCIYALGK